MPQTLEKLSQMAFLPTGSFGAVAVIGKQPKPSFSWNGKHRHWRNTSYGRRLYNPPMLDNLEKLGLEKTQHISRIQFTQLIPM